MGWFNCRIRDGAAYGISNTNYCKNEMLLKKVTKKMKFFNLSVDSVAVVKSKILIGKKSLQSVLLCEIV